VRGAVPTVLGLELGLYLWALLAAAGFAVLALLQVTLETVFYLSLAMGVSRAGAWFRKRVIQRRLKAISGTVLVGLGLRTALAQR